MAISRFRTAPHWVRAVLLAWVALTVPLFAAADSASPEESVVHVHDTEVFSFRASRNGHSAAERARSASQALEHIIDEHTDGEPHFEARDGTAVISVGGTPVAQLGDADALAAGDVSLEVHASSIVARIHTALQLERTRRAIAEAIFSSSLLVMCGLVAFLILGRVGDVVNRIRAWVLAHPSRLPALHIGGIEVVQPAAVRGALAVSLSVGKHLAQIGIIYVWILVSLSQFEATRGYSSRLTAYVLTPVYALIGRIGSAVPVLIVDIIGLTAVLIILRFIALFFGSIARRETFVSWLPADLATSTGVLVRCGVVVIAMLVGAPLLTGNDEGGFTRLGFAALGAAALAATPLLSNIAIGALIVFQRKLRTGDWVEVGGTVGRVRSVGLVETQLDDELGRLVRVPHLLSLVRQTRIFGAQLPASFTMDIDSRIAPSRVAEVSRRAAETEGASVRVELICLEAQQARYRISFAGRGGQDLNALSIAIADVLLRDTSSPSLQTTEERA